MTTATEKTTRLTEALGNLIDQFRGQVNIVALVSAVARQNQGLESAAFGVLNLTTVAVSEGVQLDGLGDVVGTERGGLSDADYRVRIGARILQNNASGTTEELLQLCAVLGGTPAVLTEVAPAKFEVDVTGVVDNGSEIATALVSSKPAGVGMLFSWHESPNPFRFDVAGQGLDEGELGESVAA